MKQRSAGDLRRWADQRKPACATRRVRKAFNLFRWRDIEPEPIKRNEALFLART